MKKTKEYQKGYWDGVYGRMTPWVHLMDKEYHAGRMAGQKIAFKRFLKVLS